MSGSDLLAFLALGLAAVALWLHVRSNRPAAGREVAELEAALQALLEAVERLEEENRALLDALWHARPGEAPGLGPASGAAAPAGGRIPAAPPQDAGAPGPAPPGAGDPAKAAIADRRSPLFPGSAESPSGSPLEGRKGPEERPWPGRLDGAAGAPDAPAVPGRPAASPAAGASSASDGWREEALRRLRAGEAPEKVARDLGRGTREVALLGAFGGAPEEAPFRPEGPGLRPPEAPTEGRAPRRG
ncbi:hypothetical protein [Hydrogenibacillus sp. N12]|uniref:hypothetical protein n=1 Tax=Hydrogenibacillus sp. N12 TaxID=2866627 RepID=UPI001C7DFE5C|nr:hypothetical protein [Hydrogenibacillus sp. N12]QZA33524.1 hypothetical protein K2M58_02975 [Hydrogenibacillus sp. N12]